MALLQPALSFNFAVVMWDVQGPNVDSTAAQVVGMVAGNIIFGSFSEVSGLEASVELETYQEGGLNDRIHKFVKPAKFPNLVMKRGITARSDLWDWHAQAQDESQTVTRKSGVVVLFDRGGLTASATATSGPITVSGTATARIPIAAWMFERGLPEKLQGPALDAKSNTVAIETLEINHERLTRMPLSSVPGLGSVVSKLPTLT